MKKPSLLKTRYAENPFINGDSFSVPLKKKAEVIQTEGQQPSPLVTKGLRLPKSGVSQRSIPTPS